MELATSDLALSTLSPIINKLGSYIYDTYMGGDVTAEEMQNLKNVVLFKIKTVIQEAELVPLDQLRPWLENLQAAAFEADDLLDLYEYKRIKNKVSSLPSVLKKSIDITKETMGFMLPKSSLKSSLQKLEKSATEAEKLLPTIKSARETAMIRQKHESPQTSGITRTVSTPSSPLFGREKECDKIIKMLLVDEPNGGSSRRMKTVPIIAIKGIGGSGKTSTAQGVYNDQRVYFDLRMWIHISRNFDVHRLTKEIVESAVKGDCPEINNLDVLQTRLKEIVSKRKNFLLVLDDVWCEDKMQWDQLLGPLNEVGGKGSKIIITTRMEEVASVLHAKKVVTLQELKVEDCWSILKHYAFDNDEEIIEDQGLINVGNQIISKVKYSPLALRVVGSLLSKRVSVHEWEKILKQDMLKETMDVLLFSFQHLPSHLQRCFAYCSLFPKGFKFYLCEDILIPLWIAQGFVENTDQSELTLEEKGSIYFNELLSYSFFENHGEEYYVMHDLFHDLAEKVSKKHCHRIEDLYSSDIPPTCLHLSIYTKKDLVHTLLPDISKLKSLRTLIISHAANSTNIFKNKKDIFRDLNKLRVLFVNSNVEHPEVLSNPHVDKLKHLRYLHIQYDKKLPGSLAKLYHLQFFYLFTDRVQGNMLKANSLPRKFGNLINLRSLKFSGEYARNMDYLYYNSEMSIEKLTSLQNLWEFRPRKNGANEMMQLKNLPLRGSLLFSNLDDVKSKTEAAEAMLNQKKNLHEVAFEWSSDSSSTANLNTCEEVLEGLEPHPNLEKLMLRRYQGLKAPSWMIKENSLSRLNFLSLRSCRSLTVVPNLPPHLESLQVFDCNELMQLPPVSNTLYILQLKNCPKLVPPSMSNESLRVKTIEIKGCSRNEGQLFSDLPFLTNLQRLELEGFPNLQTFPNLSPTVTEMKIEDFPMLTSVENLQLVASLKWLNIKKCPKLIAGKRLSVERGLAKHLHCAIYIETDEPLLVFVLVQQQAFGSIKRLTLYGLDNRPFPLLLEEQFHRFTSLECLKLDDFASLPNLEKLSSMNALTITNCRDVDLLPKLPVSLGSFYLTQCPNLKLNYAENGPLHNTISHIPCLRFN